MEMYDIKYNLPFTKKDEWKKETEMGLWFVGYNNFRVEVFWVEHKQSHLYYRNNNMEGISILYDTGSSFLNPHENKPYGYYREIKEMKE